MLLLCVSVAIGYDSFFRDKTSDLVNDKVIDTDLNIFAEFTLNFSNENYLSIVLTSVLIVHLKLIQVLRELLRLNQLIHN